MRHPEIKYETARWGTACREAYALGERHGRRGYSAPKGDESYRGLLTLVAAFPIGDRGAALVEMAYANGFKRGARAV